MATAVTQLTLSGVAVTRVPPSSRQEQQGEGVVNVNSDEYQVVLQVSVENEQQQLQPLCEEGAEETPTQSEEASG